ncbi:hypothetical protein [Clostridium sp.]|uniref:hypothetical protein n=1 Tax=Clostridium sp. TaxID=1506 RepID=UPI003D6D51F8
MNLRVTENSNIKIFRFINLETEVKQKFIASTLPMFNLLNDMEYTINWFIYILNY